MSKKLQSAPPDAVSGPRTVPGPMEHLRAGLDEQSGALSYDELRAELAARGIDSDACTAEIEAKILSWLRDNPLPCPFPSCDSRHGQHEDSTVYVEERGGGYVAECRTCCSGTGSFHSREAALDEWNQLARLVLKGSSDSKRPKSDDAMGVSSKEASSSVAVETRNVGEKEEKISGEPGDAA